MKPLKKTILYSIGYVRQKGEWLNALRQFSGRTWVDLSEMERCIIGQLDDGSAYVDVDGNQVAKEDASFIRLKTNVIVDKSKIGGESRFVVIKFRKNKYDMWEGIDFEYGDVASEDDVCKDENASTKSDPLFEDVFFQDKEGWKIELKDMAVCEDWDNGRDDTKTGLLLPYLRYTYARLKEVGKTIQSKDGNYMAFNTGLVSRETLDPIIAICNKNTRPTPEWFFDRFLIWGNEDKANPRDLATRQKFSQMPQNAEWFKTVEQTILRPELIDMSGIDDEFKVLFEKSIPLELLERMATDLEMKNQSVLKRIAQLKACGDDKTVPDDDAKMAYGDLLSMMGGKADVMETALIFLKKALVMAKKRLEWEVMTAVPMYAAYKNTAEVTFSFMLPLSFGEDPMGTDLAVVLEPCFAEGGDVRYKPKFLLKLLYAYSNARLLCRPNAEWLRGYRKCRCA